MADKSFITSWTNNNFTLLRLLAALFVLVSHSFGILNKGLQQPGLWYHDRYIILSDIGLYTFFTLSGFLVTHSLVNADSLKHYLWKRFLRIMPALAAANLVCIIAGIFLTSIPAIKYLGKLETWTYFLKNTTLLINQFTLPGVFNQLKDNSVNSSLWTILIEVECYIVLLLGAHLIVVRKWLYLSCFCLFTALRIWWMYSGKPPVRGLDIEVYFTYGTYFFLGSLFYCFKDDIPFKWIYANVLMAIALLTINTVFEPVTLALFLSYCILIIGTGKSIINLKNVDISYGLYLYAFPIQQIILLQSGYNINVWIHVTLSAVFASIAGLLSWKFIEQPMLGRKLKSLFK